MQKELTDSDLLSLKKPAQYLGGEVGSIKKSPAEIDLKVCLAFPDTYEVGMSHIGMQILYDLINKDPKTAAERAYVPLPDMAELLKKKGLPLCSLESDRPLKEFDLIGFSLQYELSGTGVLQILDLAGIPLKASERSSGHPLIIAGGPVTYHPEPLADFVDAFLVGDGENMVPEFLQAYRAAKRITNDRSALLRELTKIQGVYVPSFFEPRYSGQSFTGFEPKFSDYTAVRRQLLPNFDQTEFPTKPVIPNVRAVHDRLSVEVMRGCVRGCRFCQAGYLYRPQRERKPEEILRIVQESVPNTGYEELSLLSLSTADYCSVLPLISALKEKHCTDDRMVISFPSTRVDALKPELLSEVQSVRRAGFTLAPEAGTQRLRDVINKGVTDEEIIETCRNVFEMGWSSVKLYFMLGLPTETDADLHGIIDLARRIRQMAGGRKTITVSVSTHVPKPHTPFQWAEQIGIEETIRKQQLLRQGLKKARVDFRSHRAFSSFLEGVFARGDRRLGAVLQRAYELGCRLDGWVEEVKEEVWLQAFAECGISPDLYLRERGIEESLPWDHISCDIPKKYFLKEWERALKYRVTPDCLTESCSICGACDYDGRRNILYDRKRTQSRLNIINPRWEQVIAQRESGVLAEKLNAESDAADAEAAANSQIAEPNDTPEFGSGSLDFVDAEADSEKIDYPFLNPDKPVVIHENSPQKSKAPFSRPGKEAVQRVRITYRKFGKMKFTGHLELSSIFFRATRRAEISLAYSRGFNPKPKLLFGPPLQLGIESRCELVDLLLIERTDSDLLRTNLAAALPEGLEIVAAQEIPLKSAPPQNILRSQVFQARHPDEAVEYASNWKALTFHRESGAKSKTIALADKLLRVDLTATGIEFEIANDPNAGAIRPYEVVAALAGQNPQSFNIEKVDCKVAEVA